jgi:hypothetical protein
VTVLHWAFWVIAPLQWVVLSVIAQSMVLFWDRYVIHILFLMLISDNRAEQAQVYVMHNYVIWNMKYGVWI